MKKILEITECSRRPGIVKVMNEGKLETLAYRDKARTKPEVCECECRGRDLMSAFGMALLKAGLASVMSGGGLPKAPDADDFYYVYVDEEPKELDADASAFAGAAADIINHVK